MNRKLILPAILLLVAATFQVAQGFVDHNNRNPLCMVLSRPVCQLQISIFGEITAADFDQIKRLVDQTHQQAKNNQAKNNNWEVLGPFVSLDTPGGSVPAALAIGRLLRKEQASVKVNSDAICGSACVMVLAGAVGRYMEGKVVIHRPYLPVPQGEITADAITEQYQMMLKELRAYFREMNVNEQLADAMLQYEPEQGHVLTQAELVGYGLMRQDPIAREVTDLKAAQKYGLSREEYMNRKALADRACASSRTYCYERILETGRVDPQMAPDRPDPSCYSIEGCSR